VHLPDLLRKLEAVQVGHDDVEQDQIRLLLADLQDGLEAVGIGLQAAVAVETEALEGALHEAEDVLVVVDGHDDFLERGAPQRRPARIGRPGLTPLQFLQGHVAEAELPLHPFHLRKRDLQMLPHLVSLDHPLLDPPVDGHPVDVEEIRHFGRGKKHLCHELPLDSGLPAIL